MELEKAVVSSSSPDPADAKQTPVLSSSSDRFGCRKGGTASSSPDPPCQGQAFRLKTVQWLICQGSLCHREGS